MYLPHRLCGPQRAASLNLGTPKTDLSLCRPHQELEERLRHHHQAELQSLREAHRQSIETLKQESEQELQTLRFELEDEGKAMLGENSQSGVDFSRRIGLVQVFRCEGFFKS